MGDRLFWFEDCPKCGAKDSVEYYDHFSAITYSGHCDKCGWSDPKNYYETDENTVQLLTPEEYTAWSKETGLVALNVLSWPEEYDYYSKTGDRTVAGLAKLKATAAVSSMVATDPPNVTEASESAQSVDRSEDKA